MTSINNMPNQNIGETKETRKAKYIIAKIVMSIIGVFVALYIVSFILLLAWAIMNSLKGSKIYFNQPFSLPALNDIRWSNYASAYNGLSTWVFFKDLGKNVYFSYFRMFLNSFLFSFGTAFMGVLMNFLVAYPLGRYNFPGKKLLYNMAILLMIIPVIGNMSSSLYVRRVLGIYDNMFLHIVCSQGGFGLNFMLIYGAVKSVSSGYVDAAKIDGAGHFTIMLKICLPMVFPLMFCLFMISFTGHWNDYSTILIYLPSTPNLAYGIYYFRMMSTTKRFTTPEMLAAYVLVALPSALIWCVGQKFVMENYSVGGLKE